MPQAPASKPDNDDPGEETGGEEFPEDRPRKRQRLDQVDKEEIRLLPEITVGDGACAGNEQGAADGGVAKEDREIPYAAPTTSVPQDLPDDAPPQTKLKDDPRQSRATSLPPTRRRSARVNSQAQDLMPPPEPPCSQAYPNCPSHPQQHRPAQPADPEVLSTPTKTRRRTIPSIQPGSSSPLSDAPSEFSSPSRIFDRVSFLRDSSPLTDLPSHLGISSPFYERLTLPPAAFPPSSSLLSDPPSHLASSPFLNHQAPPRSSSPLSDPPAYLPSSPPLISRHRHLADKSSSPLSSPPPFLIHPYDDLQPRRSVSRESSPSPETREAPSNSQDPNTSDSSSTGQDSLPSAQGPFQSDACERSQLISRTCEKDSGTREAEELHCAPNPPPRPAPSSQQPFTEDTETREAKQPPSSQPVSSQGSASARLPLPNIKGRELFDASIWACPVRTSVFYTFATTLRQKVRDVTPTSSHLFIGHLRDRGKLVRCYTQNIDRIEEKVGLSTALDRGPGHRSRFSRRAPALSRANSGAIDSAAADTGLSSSSVSGQGEPHSSHGMFHSYIALPRRFMEQPQANHVPATNSRDPPHGQQEAAHTGREDGGPGSLRQGQPDPDVSGAPDGTAANGARSRGPDAPAGRSDNSSDAGSSEGNPGTAGRPNAAGAGPQRGSALTANGLPTSRCDGPQAPTDGSTSAATEVPSTTRQSQEPRRPVLEAAEGPASSQESSGGLEAGPGASKPKDGQRQSSPSSGVECVFLHGSLECLRCFRCRRVCEWEGREEQTFFGQQPECPHCAGATAAREERGKRALGVGKLRPDIVLYGEEHPNAHLISPVVTHDLGLSPDMLLILGTSLKVHGLKVLVKQFAKAVHSRGGKVVFVNFTKPPESAWGDIIDYWVAWDCDAWVADLKEKVPALWLPPGEEPKKRKSLGAKGAEKKTGEKKTAASKKKDAAGGKKGGSKKDEQTGEEIVVSSQESTTIEVATGGTTGDTGICVSQEAPTTIPTAPLHAELPGHRQPKQNSQDGPQETRPKQQRIILREDKANGAYTTWNIMESLRSLSGRTAPPSMELPSVAASRAIAAAEANQAKRESRKRRSTMAAGRAEEQVRAPAAEPQMPEVWSIHSSAPGVPQDGAAPKKMTFPPLRPSPPGNSGAAFTTTRKSLPGDVHHARTPTPKPSREPLSDTSIPARVDPRKRKLACLQPPALPEPHPSRHPASPPSILTAVKSNPRKRKRKTIDGEEVVLPSVGSRRPSPSSDKENAEGRRSVPALSAQPMDGTPIRLPPLRGAVGWRWKPAPMEPVSSPEGPSASVEWGRGAARDAEKVENPFFYEGLLGGLGSAWGKSSRSGRSQGMRVTEGVS